MGSTFSARFQGLVLLGLALLPGAGCLPPASGVRFDTATGRLSIDGTAGADLYVVSVAAGGAIVVNGGQVAIAGGVPTTANTLRIEMRGAEGGDVLELDEAGGVLPGAVLVGGPGADVLIGGSGPDTAQGGEGDDVALLGGGNDVYLASPADGDDGVEGEGGSDTLRFFGGDAGDAVDVLPNGARVSFQQPSALLAIDAGGIEVVEFVGGGGDDTITVGDLAGTLATEIRVDCSILLGSGDAAPDTVVLTGTQNDDAIALSRRNGAVVVEGLAASVRVVGAEAASDRLVLNALGGADAIDARALAAGFLQLVVNGGLGADEFVGSQGIDVWTGGDGDDSAFLGGGDDLAIWNPGDDNDAIDGEDGFDELRLNGSNVSESFTLSAISGRVSLLRSVASVILDLGTLESVDLRALGGSDLVAIGDLAASDLAELRLDLAAVSGTSDLVADSVIVFGTPGNDVVSIGGDASDVALIGLAATVTIANTDGPLDTLSVQALGGDDSIQAGDLAATAPALTVEGGDQDDVLVGGDGADVLLGDDGDDVLIGGPGVDLLDGGAGSNIVIQ